MINATRVKSALATHHEHHACNTNASIALKNKETPTPALVSTARGKCSFFWVSLDHKAAIMPSAK